MNDAKPGIVFMGTPAFAVESLRSLIENGHPVKAVITAPDRPAGRGKKLRQPPVKEFISTEHPSIPVLQPEKLKDPAFVSAMKQLEPELMVVVAFRMLPEVIWSIPSLGCFNLHASLLPDYRGAAPINHVLINGEKQTGVTTFLIDREIDTGKILLQEKCEIGEDENAGELHDRLMHLGASLVLKTAQKLAEGSLKAKSQELFKKEGEILKPAPKISREDCRIDWNRPAGEIHNFIRGLSPFPGAFSSLEKESGDNIMWKIYESDVDPTPHVYPPGTLVSDGITELKAATANGYLCIRELQQEGKKRMGAGDFLRGVSLISGQSRFS